MTARPLMMMMKIPTTCTTTTTTTTTTTAAVTRPTMIILALVGLWATNFSTQMVEAFVAPTTPARPSATAGAPRSLSSYSATTLQRRPVWQPPSFMSTTDAVDTTVTSTTSSTDHDDDEEQQQQMELTAKGLFKRDRYIATNRFSVRKGQAAAKFEKRWATRKSRLATLPGFRYFHVMRRVTLPPSDETDTVLTRTFYDDGDTEESSFENYVSFTIWQKKSDFSAWRNGEAFKEAHGGTSIGAFLSTMVNSALILRGPPRPAFYDGLLLQQQPLPNVPVTVDGWRQIEADGVNQLPAESFVAFTKYYVPAHRASAFEQAMAAAIKDKESSSSLLLPAGLVVSSLMRRDGQAKGHGIKPMEPTEPTYVVTRIFQDVAHYQQALAAGTASLTVDNPRNTEAYWTKAPETTLYEGFLVICSPEGV